MQRALCLGVLGGKTLPGALSQHGMSRGTGKACRQGLAPDSPAGSANSCHPNRSGPAPASPLALQRFTACRLRTFGESAGADRESFKGGGWLAGRRTVISAPWGCRKPRGAQFSARSVFLFRDPNNSPPVIGSLTIKPPGISANCLLQAMLTMVGNSPDRDPRELSARVCCLD
jgi:hypothetical protein